MEPTRYDLVVIGSGPAGSSGALMTAYFGKKVALVERAKSVGGAGINTGTIPSKALRESAHMLSGWRSRKLGINATLNHKTTIEEVAYHATQVQQALRGICQTRLSERKAELIIGDARFISPQVIQVVSPDGTIRLLQGDNILIATGSSPMHPPEFPFDHPRIHDSNEILEIEQLPTKLVVVGAGVIGAEYACTFAELGIEVHVVDGRDSLLGFLDQDISSAIQQAMERRGIIFHWGERVTACQAPESGDVVLTLSSGKSLTCSDVLVAAGRNSNTETLNLPAAGITAGKRGLITVNEFYQTEVPHVYAAGDVVGPPALAATGMEQARVAMCHAFNIPGKHATTLLPTGIYTIPEASMVGLTEEAAKKLGEPYVVGIAPYCDNARGRLIGDQDGLLKLIFRKSDHKLIGVHAVGEQATELVHIGLITMLLNGGTEVFNRACFNYPTLGELYKYATYAAIGQEIKNEIGAHKNDSY